MSHPRAINFEALGLPYHSPFAILSKPRAPVGECKIPAKHGRQQTGLHTPVNKAPGFNVPIPSEADSLRNQAIKGRVL